MGLIISGVIQNDQNILEAVKIASELWDKTILQLDYDFLYSKINSIQSELEYRIGISEGKELTVLSGLYRFYDKGFGFSNEEIREELILVAKALRGHCIEMDCCVRDILGEYSFYDRIEKI